MEATAEDQENLADLEKRISTTYCIQTSDTTTITLSLVSQGQSAKQWMAFSFSVNEYPCNTT